MVSLGLFSWFLGRLFWRIFSSRFVFLCTRTLWEVAYVDHRLCVEPPWVSSWLDQLVVLRLVCRPYAYIYLPGLLESKMADHIRTLFRWYHCHIRQLAYHLLAPSSHDRHGINPLPPLRSQHQRIPKEGRQQKEPNVDSINVQPPPNPPPINLPKHLLSRQSFPLLSRKPIH